MIRISTTKESLTKRQVRRRMRSDRPSARWAKPCRISAGRSRSSAPSRCGALIGLLGRCFGGSHMKLLLTLSITLVACVPSGAIAADASYMGKWTLNTTESDIGAVTMKISKDASGEFTEVDNGVLTSKFKMDENDYPTAMGPTAAWKSLDDHSWQVVYKVNGKVQEIDTLR